MVTLNLGTTATSAGGGVTNGITALSGDVTTTPALSGVAVATVVSVGGKPSTTLASGNTIVERDALGSAAFNVVSASNMFVSTPSNVPTAVATNATVAAAVLIQSLQIYDADGIETVNNLTNLATTNWIGYVLSDGHVVVIGDKILLTAQTDVTQNLLWEINGFGNMVTPEGWEIGVNIAGFRIPIIDYTSVSNRDGWQYQQKNQHIIGTAVPPPVYQVISKGSSLHGDGVTIVQPTANTLSVGVIGSANLGTQIVLTNNIANLSVTQAKLANGSVGTAQLIDGNVTQAKLANGSVGTAQLIDGNVTLAKMGSASVGVGNLTTAAQNRLVPATPSTVDKYLSGTNTYESLITNGGVSSAGTVLVVSTDGFKITSSNLKIFQISNFGFSYLSRRNLYILGGTPSPNLVGNATSPFIIPMPDFSHTGEILGVTLAGTPTSWSITIPPTTSALSFGTEVLFEAEIRAVFGGGTNNSVAAFEFGFSSTPTTFTSMSEATYGFAYNAAYNNAGGPGTIAQSFPTKATYRYKGLDGQTIYLMYTGFSQQNGTNTTTVTVSPYSSATKIISYLKITQVGSFNDSGL